MDIGDNIMKRLIYILTLVSILVISTGCHSNDSTTETVSSTENLPEELVDRDYIDEAEWEFNDDVDKDETTWNLNNQIVIEDIGGIEWVESVSISPKTYDEYVASGKVTITITVVSDEDIKSENEKNITDYIDAANFYDNYEIVLN